MERSVRVNASTEPVTPQNTNVFGVDTAAAYGDDFDTKFGVTPSGASAAAKPGDQGPCLYLGPGGERCGRRALAGGFCQWHRPNAPRLRASGTRLPAATNAMRWERRGVVLAAIIAALWPVLTEVIRTLLKLLR